MNNVEQQRSTIEELAYARPVPTSQPVVLRDASNFTKRHVDQIDALPTLRDDPIGNVDNAVPKAIARIDERQKQR